MTDGSRKPDSLYRKAHNKKREVDGRADLHRCQHCGDMARDWALVEEPIGELHIAKGSGRSPVLRWTDEVQDLIPLCRRCHRRLDNEAARDLLD